MPTEKLPACPWCHSAKLVYPHGERDFWCKTCDRLFDADPDEGGDYSTDPSKRAERTEAAEIHRQKALAKLTNRYRYRR